MHDDALAAGNLVVTIGEVRQQGIIAAVDRALAHVAHCEALVVDCDIDVIDRAQFPGAPGARPGGMDAQDFFAAARRLAAEPRVRVIDLTEWDPPLDPTDLSALTAARWLAEVLTGFESPLANAVIELDPGRRMVAGLGQAADAAVDACRLEAPAPRAC